MQKRTLSFIICFIAVLNAWSQQDVQFSHNMFNVMGFNPGYAGMRGVVCGTAIARQQWVGFKTDDTSLHPQTFSLNIDAPVPLIRGGLSLGFLQDELGFETNTGVKIGYAYHKKLTYGNLGVGFQAGFLDKGLDFGMLEPLVDDPALAGGSEESAMFIDIALGAVYQEEDWWAGLSFTQMLQNSREIGLGTAMHQLKRHVYLTGGLSFPVPNYSMFVLSPSSLIKTDFNSMQIDLNTMIAYNDRIWSGISYRLHDAVVVFFGFSFSQINVGYSYDISTSLIGRHRRSYGSHEIMVQYKFDLELERTQRPHRTTRYL